MGRRANWPIQQQTRPSRRNPANTKSISGRARFPSRKGTTQTPNMRFLDFALVSKPMSTPPKKHWASPDPSYTLADCASELSHSLGPPSRQTTRSQGSELNSQEVVNSEPGAWPQGGKGGTHNSMTECDVMDDDAAGDDRDVAHLHTLAQWVHDIRWRHRRGPMGRALGWLTRIRNAYSSTNGRGGHSLSETGAESDGAQSRADECLPSSPRIFGPGRGLYNTRARYRGRAGGGESGLCNVSWLGTSQSFS